MKVRCTKEGSPLFKQSKIYDVMNGYIIDEKGDSWFVGKSMKEINNRASQFEEVKEMTKDDIEAGYLVELRERGLCLVVDLKNSKNLYNKNCFNGKNEGGTASLNDYSDSLHAFMLSAYDIVKVYGLSNSPRLFDTSTRELLWQREEPQTYIDDDVYTVVYAGYQYDCYIDFVKKYAPNNLKKFEYGKPLQNGF